MYVPVPIIARSRYVETVESKAVKYTNTTPDTRGEPGGRLAARHGCQNYTEKLFIWAQKCFGRIHAETFCTFLQLNSAVSGQGRDTGDRASCNYEYFLLHLPSAPQLFPNQVLKLWNIIYLCERDVRIVGCLWNTHGIISSAFRGHKNISAQRPTLTTLTWNLIALKRTKSEEPA